MMRRIFRHRLEQDEAMYRRRVVAGLQA